MKAALILGGAVKDHSFTGELLSGAAYTVAADGGAAHARKMGIVPDLIVGDFDSCSNDDIDCFREKGVKIIRYPSVKDKTDSEIAADFIIRRFNNPYPQDTAGDAPAGAIDCSGACKEAVIAGALGGRYDHTLANIFLMRKFGRYGIEALMVSEECELALIKGPCERKFSKGRFSILTLLPFTPKVKGITAVNVKYPLYDETLVMPTTRGVSNEFAPGAAEACIRVVTGELMVILT